MRRVVVALGTFVLSAVVGGLAGAASLELRRPVPSELRARAEASRLPDALMTQKRRNDGPALEWDGEGLRFAQNDAAGRDLASRDETETFVQEGSRVFHDPRGLGGTTGVSCDRCHADASNTHPETFPKFQAQLGRVVLLRDMINWCLATSIKGRPLAADDDRMRALEAYIYAQRKGVELDYGRR